MLKVNVLELFPENSKTYLCIFYNNLPPAHHLIIMNRSYLVQPGKIEWRTIGHREDIVGDVVVGVENMCVSIKGRLTPSLLPPFAR